MLFGLIVTAIVAAVLIDIVVYKLGIRNFALLVPIQFLGVTAATYIAGFMTRTESENVFRSFSLLSVCIAIGVFFAVIPMLLKMIFGPIPSSKNELPKGI